MQRLSQIPVRIEHPNPATTPEPPGQPTRALALLHQVIAAIELLEAEGSESSIDIHKAPLTPEDRHAIRDALGRGEVLATVSCLGESSVDETAVPCVWWMTHRGADGQVCAESIEVCITPSLLTGDTDGLPEGIEFLRSRIAGIAGSGTSQSSSPTMRNMS